MQDSIYKSVSILVTLFILFVTIQFWETIIPGNKSVKVSKTNWLIK